MLELAERLEQELQEAVEVKNKQSLHRYVTLLTENYLKKDDYRDDSSVILAEMRDMKADIRLITERMEAHQKQMDLRFDTLHRMMEERFLAVDKRFEAQDRRFDDVNKRFEDVNKRFDDVNKRFDDVNKRFDDVNKRFDDVNKRFGMMFAFMSVGFVALSLLITVFPKLL